MYICVCIYVYVASLEFLFYVIAYFKLVIIMQDSVKVKTGQAQFSR